MYDGSNGLALTGAGIAIGGQTYGSPWIAGAGAAVIAVGVSLLVLSKVMRRR
jgi:hypothetical protein